MILTSTSNLNSAIVTICVGPSQRLFAAHEDILAKAPYFAQACRAQFFESSGKRIDLPNEEPEVFSAVLEYLYKGDYTPKLIFDKKRASWLLDDADGSTAQGETTVYSNGMGGPVLKDTVIYVCLSLILLSCYMILTAHSAPHTATPYPTSSAWRSRSKVSPPACNAAPSSPLHATLTPTRRRRIRNCVPTTSRLSSAAAAPSSGAARYKRRWSEAGRRCSSTCSWRW